jgi:hypothetical protein
MVTGVPALTGPAGMTPSVVVVGSADAVFTVYGTVDEVDAVNAVESVGVNVALSECEPSASTVLTDAVPEATVWVVPIWVVPSKNWTVPAAPGGARVAVRVSVAPWAAGLVGDTASVVVVVTGPAALMVNGTAGDVEPANAVESVGMNCAVSECDPTVSADVVT